MIVTVTMNPAVDKTVELGTLRRGELNRLLNVKYDAGGKGINVSKTIRELGGESIAVGFLGGNTGKTIVNVMEDRKIRHDFIWVDGETRTNTKVLETDGTVTELNEPGPEIGTEQVEKLLKKLEMYAEEGALFVLSGSVPRGVSKNIYADIICRLHEKRAKVLLDADGELFRKALEAGPDIIKPNRAELEEYAGFGPGASEKEIAALATELLSRGMETVAVSMGAQGAMLFRPDCAVKCPALSVKAHSTVGAGDAMVAALACAWEQGLDTEETIKLCIAASAGAVTTVGTNPPSRELVDALKEQVVIKKIGE